MVECWHQFIVKLVWLNELVFTCNTSVVLNQENEWMDTNFGMTSVAVVQLYDHGQMDTHSTWCCCSPGSQPAESSDRTRGPPGWMDSFWGLQA